MDTDLIIKADEGDPDDDMHKTSPYVRTLVTLHNLRDKAKDAADSLHERPISERVQDGWNQTRTAVTKKTRNFFRHPETVPLQYIPEKYGYVFRPKSCWELVLLSGTVCGIEFCYSAETAFVTPILLSLGLNIKFVTMIWCLSPLIGFFLTPILGSMSDSCESKFGRRRPFILMYSIGILLGLILVPNGHSIGLALGDTDNVSPSSDAVIGVNDTNRNSSFAEKREDVEATTTAHIQPWSIAFTVIGTILLDFCSDACQSPSRTYLLDVTLPNDHAAGLSTFTLMAGLGGSLGYVMGAINWEETFLGSLIGSQVNVVFTLVTLVFVVCLISTVSSFPEIPLSFFRDEKLNKEYQEKLQASNCVASSDNEAIMLEGSVNKYGATENNEGFEDIEEEEDKDRKEKYSPQTPQKDLTNGMENGVLQTPTPTEPPPSIEQHPTLKEYLKSIIQMPTSLKVLCLTNLFCWMSLVCYSLYFTDFVAEVVFGGDPQAPVDSPEYKLYKEGIRFGCWGMALYSLSCAIYSYFIEKLVKKIGAEKAYIGGQLVYSLGMVLMAITRHKVAVILLSPTAGIMYATLFTMPYLLIAHYHCKNQFSNSIKDISGIRGIGTDIAAVSSMVFLAQLILSLSMGAIVEAVGSNVATVCAAALLSGCGALSATQVTYLDI